MISVSEAVEKIPTDEKDYHKCSFMCTWHSRSSYKEQANILLANSTNSCLPTRIHPV